MFTSGKSGSFLTLNSVWEKFLSPMIIWQCARFRNQPSFQSGALTGWRPYCALYLDIYVVGPVQPDGQACYKAGFWLGCSKSVVYTGGHNSYRSARLIASCNTSQSNSHSLSYNGWRSVDSYLKSRNFQTRINNQNLLLWISEAEEMRKLRIGKYWSWAVAFSALWYFIALCRFMQARSSKVQALATT